MHGMSGIKLPLTEFTRSSLKKQDFPYQSKRSRNSTVDIMCMSLQVHFAFKVYLTEVTAELVPFFDMLQMLPLEVFAEIP